VLLAHALLRPKAWSRAPALGAARAAQVPPPRHGSRHRGLRAGVSPCPAPCASRAGRSRRLRRQRGWSHPRHLPLIACGRRRRRARRLGTGASQRRRRRRQRRRQWRRMRRRRRRGARVKRASPAGHGRVLPPLSQPRPACSPWPRRTTEAGAASHLRHRLRRRSLRRRHPGRKDPCRWRCSIPAPGPPLRRQAPPPPPLDRCLGRRSPCRAVRLQRRRSDARPVRWRRRRRRRHRQRRRRFSAPRHRRRRCRRCHQRP